MNDRLGEEPDRIRGRVGIEEFCDVRQDLIDVRRTDAEPAEEFAELLITRKLWEKTSTLSDIVHAINDERWECPVDVATSDRATETELIPRPSMVGALAIGT
jgi:hypothetical protein